MVTATADLEIRPQSGPQEDFLASEADVVIYGGAAGGGKTFALLLDPLRWTSVPRFRAAIVRKHSTMFTDPGALWDESTGIYGQAGGIPNRSRMQWSFRPNSVIAFRHCENEKELLNWHGAQVDVLLFDELTHFSQRQFFYLLSRNRGASGVRPYVRATCNPDADSWVAEFIAWWIDQDTGYPIPERAGVVRWFVRINDKTMWSSSREELVNKVKAYGDIEPKSCTFIPAKLEDNPALIANNPGYRANLLAQGRVDQLRLLGGNWKVRKSDGMFEWEWFDIVPANTIPPRLAGLTRAWDLAASEEEGDWTAGVLMGMEGDIPWIIDVVRGQWGSGQRDQLIKDTAKLDDASYARKARIRLPQDPGQAGKTQAEQMAKMLWELGHSVYYQRVTGTKTDRADGFASRCWNLWKLGKRVKVVQAPWTRTYLDELCAFPSENAPDDQVDATSDAYNDLAGTTYSGKVPQIKSHQHERAKPAALGLPFTGARQSQTGTTRHGLRFTGRK